MVARGFGIVGRRVGYPGDEIARGGTRGGEAQCGLRSKSIVRPAPESLLLRRRGGNHLVANGDGARAYHDPVDPEVGDS